MGRGITRQGNAPKQPGGLVAAPLAPYIGTMKNALALPARLFRRAPRINLVRLQGMIAAQGRGRLNDAELAPVLERAFRAGKPKAVALLINSPGGSPVQSHLIMQRVRALADEKGVPVFAFAEDVAASGGYMVLLAADEIFADSFSLVGSIGVVSAGFGFDRLIDRLGIERRVYTAGDRKMMLDPFRPERPEDVARLKDIQAEIHRRFIAIVKERRGARLTGSDEELFSGAFWSAQEALDLGIIDGIGDLRSVMRQRFGENVRLPLVADRRSLFPRGLLGRAGASALLDPVEVIAALEERAQWERFGL